MEQLRHLYLPKKGCECETSTQQVGDFPNLQTLVNFPPLNFDLEQNLVKFTCVRKLVITAWVGKICSILRSQILEFKQLESLRIYEVDVDLEVFAGACPCLYRLSVEGSFIFRAAPSCPSVWPSNLTKLVLHSSKLDERGLGSLYPLQSLQVLILKHYAYTGKEMFFHENDLPQLRHLTIEHLENLKRWVIYEGALPNLVCLEIVHCWGLKSVPDGSQYLMLLNELKVRNMLPSFTRRLKKGGADWYRVRYLPSISFTD